MNFIKEMFAKQLMVQSVELRTAEKNGREFIVAKFRSFSNALNPFGEMSAKMGTKVVTRTFWDEFKDGDNVFKAHQLFEDYKMGIFKRGTILDGEVITANVESYEINGKWFSTKVIARIDVETLAQACKAQSVVLSSMEAPEVDNIPESSLVDEAPIDETPATDAIDESESF